MKKIKTQSIPNKLLFQKNAEKPTHEQSKESFLKAFKKANQKDEGIKTETNKGSEDEPASEKTSSDNLEDENPMIVWLANTPGFENTSMMINLEQLPTDTEGTSSQRFEQSSKNEGITSVVDKQTGERFETTLKQIELDSLLGETEVNQTDLIGEGANFEKILSHGADKSQEIQLSPKELKQVNQSIVQVEGEMDTKIKMEQLVEKLIEKLPITQSMSANQDVVEELPETIRSFIEEPIDFKELTQKEHHSELSHKRKPSKLKVEDYLLTTSSHLKRQIFNTESEQLTQVEEIFPDSNDFGFTSSNDKTLAMNLNNPVQQITPFEQSIMNVEPQETVKVSAEHWVQEMETMVLEEVIGSNKVDKVVTTRLQLTPEKLGEMDIELVIHNKELTAKIIVEHAETKEWLEQKVRQLSATLAIQDIQVDDFQVIVAKQGPRILDMNLQDQPFLGEREQNSKQNKQSPKQEIEEEQVLVEKPPYKKMNSNNGRLSIWV